jgi:hypothetical protein
MFPYVNFGRIAAVVAEDSPAAPAMVLLVGRCEDLPAFVAGLSVLLSHPSNRGHPGLTAMPPIHLCFGYCMPPRPANNTDFSNEHYTCAHKTRCRQRRQSGKELCECKKCFPGFLRLVHQRQDSRKDTRDERGGGRGVAEVEGRDRGQRSRAEVFWRLDLASSAHVHLKRNLRCVPCRVITFASP